MHLLLTTFIFLFLFGIYSYSQMESLKEVSLVNLIYEKVFQQELHITQKMLQRRAYLAFKKANTNQGGKSRLSSHLHLPFFSDTKDPALSKKLLTDLIQELYSKEEFYQKALKKNPEVISLMLDE